MSTPIDIGGRIIERNGRTLIVGEIGVNHNGDVNIAKKLIDASASVGLDAVKFQTWKTENVILPGTPKARYQVETTGNDSGQEEMLRSLELSLEETVDLKRYSEEKGLLFFSSQGSPETAKNLFDMGVQTIKISSAGLANGLLLKAVAGMGLPLIVSTGLCDLEEIRRSVSLLEKEGAREIVLLHCVTMYPTPEEDLNLRFIQTLYDNFPYPVGFSDHTAGIDAAPLAVATGACLIEKHFTLDKNMEGPDHRASLEPRDMQAMVDGVRAAERMLGKASKELTDAERENAKVMRKSLVFASDIPKGVEIEIEHLAAKRPATGVSPMEYESFLGRALKRSVEKDEFVTDELFEKYPCE